MLLIVTGIEAKTYLVAIGIADYPGTNNDLRLPTNDARAVQYIFQQNGNVESVLLLNNQATRAEIVRQMDILFTKASADDMVVLFFSGHGQPGGFTAYDKALTYDDVRKAMAASRAKRKVIFADACFSGGIQEGRTSSTQAADYKDYDILLFLSSRGNEMSMETPAMRNGLFTRTLRLCQHSGQNTFLWSTTPSHVGSLRRQHGYPSLG